MITVLLLLQSAATNPWGVLNQSCDDFCVGDGLECTPEARRCSTGDLRILLPDISKLPTIGKDLVLTVAVDTDSKATPYTVYNSSSGETTCFDSGAPTNNTCSESLPTAVRYCVCSLPAGDHVNPDNENENETADHIYTYHPPSVVHTAPSWGIFIIVCGFLLLLSAQYLWTRRTNGSDVEFQERLLF